ncbi:MAG: hydrogenase 3 maturation endopeptidase HyCI [Candidatus Altiarchaeota archaeon]
MNILIGIGNPLKGDDAIGIYIAEKFKSEISKDKTLRKKWFVLSCETAIENFSKVVKKKKPENLIIIDAAEFSLTAGEFRKFQTDKISSKGLGTHSMPIFYFIEYIKPYVKNKIFFIGIQIKKRGFGKGISKELKKSSEKIIEILKDEKFDEIKDLD